MRCYCKHPCISGKTVLESQKRFFQTRIRKYADQIKWKNNSNACSLTELKDAALAGYDAGFASLENYFDADCYHDWIVMAQIATCLYNRDHAGDGLFCIIRMDNI